MQNVNTVLSAIANDVEFSEIAKVTGIHTTPDPRASKLLELIAGTALSQLVKVFGKDQHECYALGLDRDGRLIVEHWRAGDASRRLAGKPWTLIHRAPVCFTTDGEAFIEDRSRMPLWLGEELDAQELAEAWRARRGFALSQLAA